MTWTVAVLAAEILPAQRVVALPAAIDALAAVTPQLLRIAPDEALVLDGGVDVAAVADPHAIVEDDHGMSGVWVAWPVFDALVRPHDEWELPAMRPVLAQGLVAFVPAKLYLKDDGVLVMCATAHVHELLERLR